MYIGLQVQYCYCISVSQYSNVTVYWSSSTVPLLYIGLQVQNRYCILVSQYSTVTVYRSSSTVPLLYIGTCYCQILMSFLDSVSKNTQISNFMKIRAVGAELFRADRRTNGHDETKSHFSQFCEKRLKNECSLFTSRQ
jgi:hypothetical protein